MRKIATLTIVLIVLIVVAACGLPQSGPAPPAMHHSVRQIPPGAIVWLQTGRGNATTDYHLLRQHGGAIAVFHPTSLHPTSINQLSPDPGLAAVAAAIRATNPKALVVPAVVDDVLSQQPGGIDQMKQLLRDYHDGSPGSIMKQHVAMLAAAAKPYDGLAIDYEFTFEGFTGDVSVYAQGFDILVRSLRNALRPDQIIAVTAKPRTNPNAASAPARTYDYHQLGLTADLVEVMAYDKAWSSGQPGEIAPTSWVASVANYAHNELAGTGTSTVLLIGNYGYDWPVGISGTSTQPAATLSATRLTTVPGYSPTATSWTYQQDGQRHIVSQITASAMHNEIVTIANPNGQRVGFWSASESDPEGWAKIKAALQ